MKKINTNNAPAAIGPYSQAYTINGVVYTSGQVPVDPTTGKVAETIQEQTKQSCENVKAILTEAGASFETVFKTTCFLTDMADFAAFNDVYEEYFTSKPARSCVAVKQLPLGVRCEIEVIALIQ